MSKSSQEFTQSLQIKTHKTLQLVLITATVKYNVRVLLAGSTLTDDKKPFNYNS